MAAIFALEEHSNGFPAIRIEASVYTNTNGDLQVSFPGHPETKFSLEDGKLVFTITEEDGSSMSIDLSSHKDPQEPNALQCLLMHKGESATPEPMYFSDLIVPEMGLLMKSMIDMGGGSVQNCTFPYNGPLYFASDPDLPLKDKKVVMGENNWEIHLTADDGWEYVYEGIGYIADFPE